MIEYLEGGAPLLDAVEPLWNKLKEHHAELASHFAGWFASRTFAQRRATLCNERKVALRVDLAQEAETGQTVGYCVTSVSDEAVGEIESIYVEADYRKLGIGDALMRRALAWLEGQGVSSKQLAVAVGNEQVLAFYARYGFYPRLTLLQQLPREAA